MSGAACLLMMMPAGARDRLIREEGNVSACGRLQGIPLSFSPVFSPDCKSHTHTGRVSLVRRVLLWQMQAESKRSGAMRIIVRLKDNKEQPEDPASIVQHEAMHTSLLCYAAAALLLLPLK